MPKHSDYKNAFIYKFVCNDIFVINIYVGSSVNWVQRKASHKSICNNENDIGYNKYLYQFIRENGGWANWSMIKICHFPCDTRFQLEAEERRYIELLKADLNKYIPTRTKKEWIVDNKEKIADYKKNYYIDNKEKVVDYQKNYRVENKEKSKKPYPCDCGGKYIHSTFSRHIKSQKHQQFIKQGAIL